MSCTLDNRFSCDNKHCIPMYQRCDGVDNCGDGSDENDLSVCGVMHNIRQCDHYTEFTCANRECVNKSKLCNLQYDCEDLSDEKGCREYFICTSFVFHTRVCFFGKFYEPMSFPFRLYRNVLGIEQRWLRTLLLERNVGKGIQLRVLRRL